MATSITVTWTRSVVEVDGVTKYRLETVCSSPVGIPDAGLFLFEGTEASNTYRHVCTVGDMLYYYNITLPTSPLARRIVFDINEAHTAAVPSDITKTVVGAGATSDGTLLAYNNTEHAWVVAPTAASDVFPIGDTVSVVTGTGTGEIASSAVEDKFRADSLLTDYDTPQDAMDAETLQRSRIQNLITDWDANYSTYEGVTSQVIAPV